MDTSEINQVLEDFAPVQSLIKSVYINSQSRRVSVQLEYTKEALQFMSQKSRSFTTNGMGELVVDYRHENGFYVSLSTTPIFD